MSTREWPMAISLVPTACALQGFASTPSRARTPHKSVKRNRCGGRDHFAGREPLSAIHAHLNTLPLPSKLGVSERREQRSAALHFC